MRQSLSEPNVYYEASTQQFWLRVQQTNKMCQVDINKVSDMNHVEMKVTKHLLKVKNI